MSDPVDLSGLDVRPLAQEGVDMPLLSPAGRPTGVTVRVRGRDSQAYQDTIQAQVRRAIERAPRKATTEERNAEFWELQATLVVSWAVDGKPAALVLEKGGPALECTPRNVAAALENHAWLFEQVNAFADKRANFLPGSESS